VEGHMILPNKSESVRYAYELGVGRVANSCPVLIQYSFLIGPWSAHLTIEQLDIPTIVGHGAVEPVAHSK